MSPTTPNLLRRVAATLVALAVGLGGMTAASGAASAADADLPGYVDLRDRSAYFDPASTWTVLHLDTQHTSNTGFWYAIAEDNSYIEEWTPVPVRNMTWVFQPWGTWCDSPYKEVGWNEWVNGYRCGPDVDALTADYPDYLTRRDACRDQTGREYTDAVPADAGDGTVTWTCDDWVVDDTRLTNSNSNYIKPATRSMCAPWEPQEPDGYGNKACYHQFYAWLSDPRFPSGGLAGGTAGTVTRSATVTRSVARSVTVTRSAAATARVTRRTVTRSATGRVGGVRRTVTGSAPVVVSRTAKAARTRTAAATRSARATASCTATTPTLATQCAAEKAVRTAKARAASNATAAATSTAAGKARTAAAEAALATARKAAAAAPIPTAAVRDATTLAQRRADAKLAQLRG